MRYSSNISTGNSDKQPAQCRVAITDPLEKEANIITDRVMSIPAQNFIQRKCSECEKEEDGQINRKTLSSFIQRKESSVGTEVTNTISNSIKSSKGNGSKMDEGTKSFMENSFGAEFSSVDIHIGNEASQLNRQLNAKAFTIGNDIYFNSQEYQPYSDSGKHLLAHELTHVVQQNGKIQKKPVVTNPGPLTKEQFIEIMQNTYGVTKIYAGTMEDQIKSMYLDPTKVKSLPGWVNWDPDEKPQIYQYIVDAYAEFNKAFHGFPRTTEIAFYKFSYEKLDSGNIIMRKDVVAMFGASDLLIFSPITADNALPFARSIPSGNYPGVPADAIKDRADPQASPLVKPTERESAMRFIFHELGHGLQAAATSSSDIFPGEPPDFSMNHDYAIEIGRPPSNDHELYDAGVPSVYTTIQQGQLPPDNFKITKANWNASKWVEQPITEYMVTSGPGEDFAEAVMTFVANPSLLQARSPLRYNFINKRRALWQSRFATPNAASATTGTTSSASKPTSPPTVPVLKNGGLKDEELNRIALQLRRAMAGWGTDEDSIYSALSGRTQEQVDAIAQTYQSIYHRSLLSDLKNELTDSEMQHLAIFSPIATDAKNKTQTDKTRADLIAIQLRDAMSGWGTNENSIMAALTGRSASEREEIKKAYKRLTNHELETDLHDELSGNELERALKLLNEGILIPEEESFWSKLWGGIKSVAGAVWKGIKMFAGWTWDILKSAGGWLWDLITWLPQRIWGLIKHVASGIAGIARWLWDIVHVIKGDKGLSEWIVDGLLRGAFWVLKLVAKVADLFGIGEVWTLVWNVIKFNTRTLNEIEIQEAKKVFGNSISYWQVRIDEKSLISKISLALNNLIHNKKDDGMGITTAHTINFNRKIDAQPGNNDMRWVIHELTHVSQYSHLGLQYIGEALHAQMFGAGYGYNEGLGLVGKNLSDFNREQQASIVSDYYCSVLYATSGSCDHIPSANSYVAEYTKMRNQAVMGQF